VDLEDATLMFLAESAAYPAVAELAQSAYDRLIDGDGIDYRVLDELVGQASAKGVLRKSPANGAGRAGRTAIRRPARAR
jgi:hypothetical protein